MKPIPMKTKNIPPNNSAARSKIHIFRLHCDAKFVVAEFRVLGKI